MYQDKAILRSKKFSSERVHAVESFQNSVTQGHTLDVLSDKCELAKYYLVGGDYVDLNCIHQDLEYFANALLSMVYDINEKAVIKMNFKNVKDFEDLAYLARDIMFDLEDIEELENSLSNETITSWLEDMLYNVVSKIIELQGM